VARACERCEAAGVRAGMTVAHARSLLCDREVRVEPYTPDEDARQLRRLARWALRFSPIASPDDPDGLLLDIAGCAHLYGGEENLAERVAEFLEQLGLEARIAVAPTFACAQAVARSADRRITIVSSDAVRRVLDGLPMAALRVDLATCEALAEVGIEHIGQLVDLPRAQLAARFGNELLHRIDQALGRSVSELIQPVHLCEPLEVSRLFDGPVVCLEAVQAACRELLSLLIRQLVRRESGVRLLTLAFRRINAAPVTLTLRLTHPSRDEAHLGSLLRPRLERLHLGFGIEEIHLRAVQTEGMGHSQIELWPGVLSATRPDQEDSWGRLLDQLIERLGPESVTVVTLLETHVPEQAFVFRSWGESDGGGDRSGRRGGRCDNPPKVYPAARPSRLFGRPEPVRVMTLTPDGPLLWLRWRGRDCAVRRCLGPERITLPWWLDSALKPPLPTRERVGVSRDSSDGSRTVPEGPRTVATGGAPPAAGRAERNPWIATQRNARPRGAEEVGKVAVPPPRRGGSIFFPPPPRVPSGCAGLHPWLPSCAPSGRTTGESVTRDYYTVEGEGGDWLWVFRDRVTGHWFVHGEWV